MKHSKPDDITYSKEKTFQCLSNIRFLYSLLSEAHQIAFIKSLKKNPIRVLIENPAFTIDQINFYAIEDYFIFEPSKKKDCIFLIRKSDVTKSKRNLQNSILNDWKMKKHFLN